MKLTIGRKLIAGFLFVSLLAAGAGVTGIYNIGVVSRAADVILHEKVPVADMSMETKTDICRTRDNLAELLLQEDLEQVKAREAEFKQGLGQFDAHLDAILKGDPAQGVPAAPADSETARDAQAIQDLHENFQRTAQELITHHNARLQSHQQMQQMMSSFDQAAEGFAGLLDAREQELGVTVDRRLDAIKDAKALMYKMKAIVEEYVALERASRPELRQDLVATLKEFEDLKPTLPAEVVKNFEDMRGLVVGQDRLLDLKDKAMADHQESRKHSAEADEIGARIDAALVNMEADTGKDMQGAMALSDRTQTRARATLLAVTIAALLAGIVIGALITRSLTRPLSQCVDFARQVSQGNLTQQIQVSSSDETRDLADALNRMLVGLRDMVGSIRTASSSVAAAARQIDGATSDITGGVQTQASAAEETSASMEEMAVIIQNVARNAEGLAANVEETTASIQQTGSSAEGVARSAESMAANVAETSASIEQIAVTLERTAQNAAEATNLSRTASTEARTGGDALLQTIESMRRIGGMMGEITGVIQNLGQRSKAIGGIIEVIEEIADQTNLLALNAAIEAARAGDAGRGFAVVADEVRKLAERSIKATREIAGVIEKVQTDTDAAVAATEEGARRSQESIELADRAGVTIRRIMESVTASSTLIEKISSATAEQSIAAKNILQAVEDMNKLTQAVSRSTVEQAAGIRQVVSAAENMAIMTEQVKNSTSEQKKGGENVVRAVENIADIAKNNLAAVQQLSGSVTDLGRQSGDLQSLVARFQVA